MGALDETRISDSRGGIGFVFMHSGEELAVLVDTLVEKVSQSKRGDKQGPAAVSKRQRIQCNRHLVHYGGNVREALKDYRRCTWEEFHCHLYKAICEHKPDALVGFEETSTRLLSGHRCQFAKAFLSAANHEYKKRRGDNPIRRRFWESLYTQQLQSWILQKSELSSQLTELQNEKGSLNKKLKRHIKCLKDLKLKEIAQQQEIEGLQNELTEYRVNLGQASSGFTSINIASEANFPPADEVLKKYDKLASHLMNLYDNAVYDQISGKSNRALQVAFAVNLTEIFQFMWETICYRYSQLLRDLIGCADITTISIASIQKCDLHCREYWECLFMRMLDGIVAALVEQKGLELLFIMDHAEQEKASGPSAEEVVESSPERYFQPLDGVQHLNVDQNTSAHSSPNVLRRNAEPSSSQGKGMDFAVNPVLQEKEASAEPNEICGQTPVPKALTRWFYAKLKKETLKRLWQSVVLLFLQRPVMGLLPKKSTTTVEFDSNIYSVHDDAKVEERDAVLAVLPPVYCGPNKMIKGRLGFQGCECDGRVILKKGMVDLLGME